MEIVVVGRHTELSEKFRLHVEDKLAKINLLAPTAQRIDVEVTHETNPRLSGICERVELTVRDKGPVVRAEASADDSYAALDLATTKLLERLRRARDRHKDHRTNTPLAPVDVRPAPPAPPVIPTPIPGAAVEHMLGDSPVVIREKVHAATPMTVDDVLTTGATLAACASAVERVGGVVVGALTIAATPPPGSRPGDTRVDGREGLP